MQPHSITPEDAERFWSLVLKTDRCWFWAGPRDRQGYGSFEDEGAHRYSYRLAHGEVPPGKMVCHLCDCKYCVRPHHLYAGTASSNFRDMRERNPGVTYDMWRARVPGRRTHPARLADDQVREMRRLYAAGVGTPTLGKQFGVCQQNAWLIVHNRLYQSVPPEV